MLAVRSAAVCSNRPIRTVASAPRRSPAIAESSRASSCAGPSGLPKVMQTGRTEPVGTRQQDDCCITFGNPEGPAQLLARLDSAIAGLRLGALATVLIGRLEQTAADRTAGVHRLRWSSAGHLPPLVVGPDGTPQLLTNPRAGLLLGVDPSAVRTELEAVLDQGSTVLLYTDGLVERRDQVFDDGIALLGRALVEEGDRPLEELCDALLHRLVPHGAEDDVALVAVRLLPRGVAAAP